MIPYTIIHPDFLVHKGIMELMSRHPAFSFKCKNYFYSVPDAITHLPEDDTRIVILGVQKEYDDHLVLIDSIKKKLKNAVVILIGSEDLVEAARKCLMKGALGYLYSHCSENEFLEAIDRTLKNEVSLPFGFRIHPNLHDMRSAHRTASKLDFELTLREKEVLLHISNGLNNKDISSKLFISDQTVAVHRKNLFRKLGVKNSISLIKVAKEKRLIE